MPPQGGIFRLAARPQIRLCCLSCLDAGFSQHKVNPAIFKPSSVQGASETTLHLRRCASFGTGYTPTR